MTKAREGQRVKLTEKAMGDDVIGGLMRRFDLNGEGTILEGPRFADGPFWVSFGEHEFNVYEEEFDVAEDVVTLRLDEDTLSKIEDVFMDSHSYADLRAALKALDVTK